MFKEAIGKIVHSKLSPLFLILFIAVLYVTLSKGIIPFVEKVARSDLFLEKAEEFEAKDRSSVALLHCNDFVRAELGGAKSVQFESKAIKSWEISNGRYLVTSQVTAEDESGKPIRKNFACNVQYSGGDENDHSHWSLQGLEMRDL
jgi:hypothetical protein